MMDHKLSKLEKKMRRKMKKSSKIFEKFEGLQTVDHPTRILLVGNGGLVNGIHYETLFETFEVFGKIEEIVMVPDRPYAIIIYHKKSDAVDAVQLLNGASKTNSDGTTVFFYLSYIKKVPDLKNSNTNHEFPCGLIILPDFVDVHEEKLLLKCINFEADERTVSQSLKHRVVRHYGYEFKYGTNDVDKQNPLKEKIPHECEGILHRLVEQGFLPELPDQLTVNRYFPKQGIPPHIDTHSAFEDGIISVSLGSQVIMDFRHPSGKRIPVYLPRRSVLIMTGESRYLWTHGISQRKTDIVPLKDHEGERCLTLMERSVRTSFTFRKIRHSDCTCDYIAVCNSQVREVKGKENLDLTNKQAHKLEEKHVFQVYEGIADHFSCTRHKPWPEITNFLKSLPVGSLLFDVGCGNGKYLGLNASLLEIGCDISSGLLGICHSRGIEVFQANGLHLPLRSGVADACLSIAVLHHFSTQERREHALLEITRLLQPGGLALIYVWAFEQDGPTGPSNYLKSSKVKSVLERENEEISISSSYQEKTSEIVEGLNLPIHKNRTSFCQQDLLVPWMYKNPDDEKSCASSTEKTSKFFHRFYHVFRENELESCSRNIPDVSIVKSYYDKGNWCMVVKKR